MIEFIETNRILIALIIIIIVATFELIFKRNKINKLEKTVEVLKKENKDNTAHISSLQKTNSDYYYNTLVLANFIIFYNILTEILTSKLGAKADGFTYRTFDYKKKKGVTIEKKVNTKKVRVKGEVGYIIKDKYFIKKADLDILLLSIQQQIDEELMIQKSYIENNNLLDYDKLLVEYPNLLAIEVEDVRGEGKHTIND